MGNVWEAPALAYGRFSGQSQRVRDARRRSAHGLEVVLMLLVVGHGGGRVWWGGCGCNEREGVVQKDEKIEEQDTENRAHLPFFERSSFSSPAAHYDNPAISAR